MRTKCEEAVGETYVKHTVCLEKNSVCRVIQLPKFSECLKL